MSEIVKRHFVIVFVGLVEEIAQRGNVYGKLSTEIVVQIHLLEQQQKFFIFPLAAVKRGHP